MIKWEGKHKHRCPDCGVEFDCPCGKSCGVEYDKYPCVNDIMKHVIEMHSTPQKIGMAFTMY